MALHTDLIDLLAAFDAEAVEYLLVGGQAVALHGAPRFTKDTDLWLRDSEENLGRAKRALQHFGAPGHVIAALDEAETLDVVWIGNLPARIDLMKGVPGGDFERAWITRQRFTIESTSVNVVSLEELIRLKRASGRPQDLVDVAKLSDGS